MRQYDDIGDGRNRSYLGDKLSHELYHVGVITKLPDEHHHLFHLNFALIVFAEDIVDKTVAKPRFVMRFFNPTWRYYHMLHTLIQFWISPWFELFQVGFQRFCTHGEDCWSCEQAVEGGEGQEQERESDVMLFTGNATMTNANVDDVDCMQC